MFTPIIDRKSGVPVYMQIRHQVVDEIVSGRMPGGDSLPSVRKFADYLEISTTTIENAYSQLLAEGYIKSIPGKGYYTEDIDVRAPVIPKDRVTQSEKRQEIYDYDFASEYVSPETFDFRLWKKHINHVLNYDSESLYAFGDVRGEYALREAISKQFYRSRGVVADPEAILVGSGVTPLLSVLSTLLHEDGIKDIALENPGFRKAYSVFEQRGMNLSMMAVTPKGTTLDGLDKEAVRACYVSPSHHFPTGYIMPVKTRQKILSWASAVHGYIIEDDYNFELRFEGKPIPAMQSMDKDQRVVYLGSFSTVLAPAIRLSFIVLPPSLKAHFDRGIAMHPQTASKLEQLALARLIDSGDFERHIRRLRKLYSRKQEKLLMLAEDYLPPSVKAIKVKAGLQILLSLPKGMDERTVVERCREASVKISGLDEYMVGESHWPAHLVLSFRGIESESMATGIKRIGETIGALEAEIGLWPNGKTL